MKTLTLVVLGLPVAVASAATITVNSKADNTTAGDGLCTLREAIANVNAAADTTSGDCAAGTGAGDTVTFSLAPSGRIKLTLGELVIAQNVTIVGPPMGSLRVSGANISRVFNISTGVTTMSDLIIEQGSSGRLSGGGILNNGTLTLTHCTLTGNNARYAFGGGIGNSGTLTLTDCTLKGNRADVGGGVVNQDGTLTVINSTFKRNYARCGGGIVNEGNAPPATAMLINCTLTGNRSPQCSGGIENLSSLTLANCTLAGNRGNAGGGIQNLGTVTLTNCTLQGNRAVPGTMGGLGGGGIYHSNYNLGIATLTNTIVAGSGASGNCGGDPITSNGHNLSSDANCFTSGGTDLVNTDPMLAQLANYGGPTDTLAACSGAALPRRSCRGASPAIDAGDDTVTGPPDNLTADQRGLPRRAGAHVDIGAYEVQ